jgi:hypothetical protein
MRARGLVLVLLAALAPPAGTALAQGSGGSGGSGSGSAIGRLLGPILREAAKPDALTASYSGALSFSGPQTNITAAVTHGRVQCSGSMSTGDGSVSYAGVGKIDLELGVGGTSESGQTLRDQYRITLHCPASTSDPNRSLADIANTSYQPGGRVSQSRSTGGLVGPELLKGEWRANGEVFSWHLCRGNCRP